MKHLKAVNKKAHRIEEYIASAYGDIYGQQQRGGGGSAPAPRPHYPIGCAVVFSPGWEVDSAGGTAGLCQPAERDLYDCYITCYWPAQVPDHYNNYPDWTSKCASATKDWRDIDLVFP
jgi:Quinohemoprotein amine dehydrogenase, gamma subunit